MKNARGAKKGRPAERDPPKSMEQALGDGHVEVDLHGRRLKGRFALIRTRFAGKKQNWLLIKMKDWAGSAHRRAG